MLLGNRRFPYSGNISPDMSASIPTGSGLAVSDVARVSRD
jgi:hypothetical protein